MNHDMVAVENEALISVSLVRVLSKLRHLDTYAVNLIPPSEAILGILGANRIQLKQLMMHLGCSFPIEEIFNFVIAASSTSILSSLLVECGHTTNSLAVSRGLMNLGRSLQNLTHLKVSYGYADYVALLFVDVLQNLTLLESLEFGLLQIRDGMLDDAETAESNASIYLKITSISRCRINCMRLYASLNGDSEQDIFKKSNSLFSFIFLSCPVLETFDLNVGQVFIGGGAYGGIDLDFRGQANLKEIIIKHINCHYYTFCHEFGKYWKNINVPTTVQATPTPGQIRTPFHFNLAWNTDEKIDVQLSDCQQ